MLEDIAVRKFSEATSRNYIRHIAEFAKFLGRSPDAAAAEDVRRFQVHMTECGARPSTLNSATSALRFFFGTTLNRPELARHQHDSFARKLAQRHPQDLHVSVWIMVGLGGAR
jgi:site-specific recombinase XerD